MSFERPTLSTLIERTGADVESRLSAAQLRRSNARVFARVLAGASHVLHGRLDYIAKQLFFDTAEGEYLDRWGSVFGIYRKQATKATGSVAFSFSDGEVDIPVGTIVQSEDGVQYETTTSPSSGVAEVRAIEAGAAGDLEEGDELSLVSPIAGVLSEAVCHGISGGTDEESDDDLRERLFERARETPCGGAAQDYVGWAKSIAGVTRAWVYPMEDGDGTVVLRFVCDEEDSIIPSAEMVARVQSYIDEVRPVTARVRVSAPVTQAVNIRLSSVYPDTSAVKEAIRSALKDLFLKEAVPGGAIYVSHIRAAISAAAGEVDHTLVSPSADVTSENNQLLVLGTLTWS